MPSLSRVVLITRRLLVCFIGDKGYIEPAFIECADGRRCIRKPYCRFYHDPREDEEAGDRSGTGNGEGNDERRQRQSCSPSPLSQDNDVSSHDGEGVKTEEAEEVVQQESQSQSSPLRQQQQQHGADEKGDEATAVSQETTAPIVTCRAGRAVKEEQEEIMVDRSAVPKSRPSRGLIELPIWCRYGFICGYIGKGCVFLHERKEENDGVKWRLMT